MSFTRGQAITGLPFSLRDRSTGGPVSTGSATAYIVKDGGAQAAVADAPVSEGNGQWSVNLSASETEADLIGVLMTHPSAVYDHKIIRTGRGFPRNTAVTGLPFVMISSSDGSPVTTGTVTGYTLLDGGSQVAIADTPVHKGNGQWTANLTAAEFNGDVVGLLFTHPSGVAVEIPVKTVSQVSATDQERLWSILTAARDGLRNDLSFQPQGGDSAQAIDTQAIVIRKYGFGRPDEGMFQSERRPGIIISPPSSVVMNPEAGENDRDDVEYPVLFQIIDSDSARDRQANLRTYVKWQEQVARYFRNQSLTDSGGNCLAWISYVSSLDNIDERVWVRHPNFVSGVLVRFVSRETRGIT